MEDVLAENGCKGENEMENNFQFLMYHSAEEDISVNAFVKDETIWLTQRGMAKLFDCSTDNISLHLKNIYAEGELLESTTAEESSVVQTEGARQVRRKAKLYNLRSHGADNMEKCTGRPSPQVGCDHCQKLSVRKTDPPAGTHGDGIL